MINNGGWVDGTGTSFTVYDDGVKTVKVREIDAAGNVGSADSYTFTLDTAASIGLLSAEKISNGTGLPITTSDTDFDLVLTSVETNASVDYQVRYTAVGGTPSGSFTTLGAGISNTATVVAANGDGLYEFKAVVTDDVGNTADSNVFKVNVAATGPTLDSAVVTLSDPSSANSIGETYTLALGCRSQAVARMDRLFSFTAGMMLAETLMGVSMMAN